MRHTDPFIRFPFANFVDEIKSSCDASPAPSSAKEPISAFEGWVVYDISGVVAFGDGETEPVQATVLGSSASDAVGKFERAVRDNRLVSDAGCPINVVAFQIDSIALIGSIDF